jgi:hypothetical protein
MTIEAFFPKGITVSPSLGKVVNLVRVLHEQPMLDEEGDRDDRQRKTIAGGGIRSFRW